ncbi:MAG: DEAD/DEAH box helicase [Kofleriaceae bacterium]|nr:DEAD/DEAH box helicase [Kofleriaceae bacterium]
MPFLAAHPSLLRALAERGYAEPTPVQAAVLGVEAYERDLLVSAQTGSGKTVAFGLAMAPNLLGENERFAGNGSAPMALCVCPTRELALQVQRELQWLYAKTGARIATCVGGMDIRREQMVLSQGVHIVVGTPGRLTDHLERGRLDLTKLKVVVLDEADEMLDMGFREDLEHLLKTAPTDRRTLLFSATIPREIAELAKKFQKNAHRLATASEGDVHRDIEYRAVPVMPREKERAVVNILRFFEANGALVFCATRDGVSRLTASLQERGFSVVALSGELSQRERTSALQALRDRRAKVCVATDVAARGLDLPDLGLVIHGDIPQSKEIMLHRSGRTGRAGKKGTSVLIVPDPSRHYVERMLRLAHLDVKWTVAPSSEQIRELDQERLLTTLNPMFEELTDEDRVMGEKLLGQRSPVDLAAALMRMQRQQLPEAEDLTVPMSMRGSRGQDSGAGPSRAREPMRGPGPAAAREAIVTSRPGVHVERAERAERPARAERVVAEHATDKPARAERPVREHREAIDTRPERAPRTNRETSSAAGTPGSSWFAINVGTVKNADPKWLIPLLCRRGDVDKSAIGKIRVLARETHVEILAASRKKFAEAIARPIEANDKDKSIRIAALKVEQD